MTTEIIQEQRVRRMARRREKFITKERKPLPGGQYRVKSSWTGVAEPWCMYGATLEEIETSLNEVTA